MVKKYLSHRRSFQISNTKNILLDAQHKLKPTIKLRVGKETLVRWQQTASSALIYYENLIFRQQFPPFQICFQGNKRLKTSTYREYE